MTDGAARADRPASRPAVPGVRQLGLLTVLCIGVNNIVGSGIYRKPSQLAEQLGPASWLAFAVDAVLLTLVALCFAAMASRHDESGGPYVYARQVFGKWVGFVVAWTAWISMWAAAAAVCTAIPSYLAVFFPGADRPTPALVIGLSILAALCTINCIGVKPAAGTSTFLTIAKVVPLLLFVLVGIFFVKGEHVAALPTSFDAAGRSAFGAALFAAFFPLQGFEVVPVPAGELKNPRRDVPLSVTGALLLSGALYCLIQVVTYGVLPTIATDPVQSERPIAEAAATFMGRFGEGWASFGRGFLALGACISILGFAAVTILCAPRFLVALGEDGLLPPLFARKHPRWQTPVAAVLATGIAAAGGGLVSCLGDNSRAAFDQLTALSNVAVLVQYTATCLAVIVVMRRDPRGGWRLPGGPFLIPVAGLAVCLLLGCLIALDRDNKPLEQLLGFVGWTVGGLVLALLTRRFARKNGGAPPAAEAPQKRYAATTAQPYVWSPGEKESLARTRGGGANPWADAARASHARTLAAEIRRRWRDEVRRSDGDLLAWLRGELADANTALESLEALDALDPAILRSLRGRLDELGRR